MASQSDDKAYLFEQMPVPRAVMNLAVPMVLSSLVTVIYNIADTYFVGMVNDPVQNAAVTLIYPITLAFCAINNLFGIGSSSMMSRCLGGGDYDRVRTSSAFGFYGALAGGLLFSLIGLLFGKPLLRMLGADELTMDAASRYLFWTVICGAAPAILNVVQSQLVRSEGSALHASIGTMSGCILNIILDPFFILPWGLNLGSAGAGITTFVSNLVACIYFLILARVKKGKTYICLNPRQLTHLDRKTILGILNVGIPASVQNLLNVTGASILTKYTASYGASAVAAMGIAQKINSIPFQISLGFSQGIMPLVSYNFASGDRSRMKKCILFAIGVIVPVMSVVAVCCWTHAEALVRIFMDTEEILFYGSIFLRPFCVGITFLCIDFVAIGVYQALGFGKFALMFAVLRKVILEIPLLLILNRVWPLYGLTWAQAITEIVLACAGIAMILKIFRRYGRSIVRV